LLAKVTGLVQLLALRNLLLKLLLELLQLTLQFFDLGKVLSILICQQLLLGTKLVFQGLDLA
jgi:hypothetical protein